VTWDELVTGQEFTDKGLKWAARNEPKLAGADFAKGPEIVPGWTLRLAVTNDGRG
jgi:hypothetical protein